MTAMGDHMPGTHGEEDDRTPGLAPGDELTLTIEDLAYGGRGVARVARRVIFVEGALPGERLRARVVRTRPAYAEAAVLEILTASPDRVTPPCEHYGVCGGCDLQHLGPEAQARARRGQVMALLARIAGIPRAPVSETVRGVEPWGYRFRMDFDWTADGPRHAPALGLHRRGRPEEIVPIRRCHLMSDGGNAIVAFLSAEAAARRLAPWEPERRSGLLRRAAIQEARATREALVTLETGRGDPPALPALARELARRFPRVVGVVRREFDKAGRLVQESILLGRDHLFEEVGGDRFKIPAGAFFQPNVHLCEALRSGTVEALAPQKAESILELYCGVGFLTLAVARRAERVEAVEGSAEAVRAARENAARAGASGVRFINREISAALPDLLRERRWDAILLDPPRAGLPRGVASAIAASGTRRLVYVSCDPAILARDLKILLHGGAFALEEVRPYELFPQTRHVECVARLTAS